MQTRWHVAENDADWLAQALAFVAQAEAEAIVMRNEFHIALAGGSTPRRLYQALAAEHHDWSRWVVWYGDERCLPPGHAERNSAMAEAAWLDRAVESGLKHFPIPAELGATAAATAYADVLAGVNRFDLVLLGLGEDGHTASLFPGHDWGREPDAPATLAVFDAPKPPPERVSLSARRLGAARQVLFLVTGAGKREAVAEWRRSGSISAASVMTENGVDVLLDKAANGGER